MSSNVSLKSWAGKPLSVVLALLILAALGAIVYLMVVPKAADKFTEFYILGPNGRASNYPANAIVGTGTDVIVGTINHEHRNVSYDLVITLNDTRKNTKLYSEQLTLADNQTWEKKISVVPDREGTDMKLEFLLYKDGNQSAPYRDLHIWLNVTAPGEA